MVFEFVILVFFMLGFFLLSKLGIEVVLSGKISRILLGRGNDWYVVSLFDLEDVLLK